MTAQQLAFIASASLCGLVAGIFLGSQLAQVPMRKAANTRDYI